MSPLKHVSDGDIWKRPRQVRDRAALGPWPPHHPTAPRSPVCLQTLSVTPAQDYDFAC
jgi:hypothetical protein